MFRILWNGKAAMNANQQKLEAISNNLANVGTTGYKRQEVSFKDLLSESLDRQGYPTEKTGAFTGTGVRTTSWNAEKSQGVLMDTGISSNLAIDGEGYFKVTTSDGSAAYTRDGNFKIDSQGTLVDSNGNKLSIDFDNGFSENSVKFTNDNFNIDDNGIVSLKNNNTFQRVGKISLFNAMGDNSMISIGQNLYLPSNDANLYTVTNADIKQGFVEGSNVDITEEFSEMILTQRAFELGSKSIKTADEMWGMINNLKGK
jgi:flagellar basal-body rod protein FlgG